jgi:hypothetical protein
MPAQKYKACPACGSQVEAEVLNCPACPHSWASEDDAGIPKKRYGRGFGPLPWVLALGVIGLILWKTVLFVIKFADPDGANAKNNAFVAVVEAHKNEIPASHRNQVVGGAGPSGSRHGGGGGGTSGGPGGGAPEGTVSVTPGGSGPSGGTVVNEEGQETLVIGQSNRTEPMAKEWRLRGTVYNLLTLEPIKRVTITFKDNETNQTYETVTDREGKYKTLVPSLPSEGYYVSITHPDYAQSYADPSILGMKRKSWDERKEMAQSLNRSLDPPSQVQGWGKKPVITDFYLAPKKGDY